MNKQKEAAENKAAALARRKKATNNSKPAPKKSRADEIDKIFNDKDDMLDESLQKFDRPSKISKARNSNGNKYKFMTWFLFLIIIIGFSYFMFVGKDNTSEKIPVQQGESGWYSVKLLNGEVYYGQIEDLSADPVIVKNVYYNYDQLNSEEAGEKQETGNLRLVKRGKEIHGPDGTLSVVRAQVVYMEPMKEDSKVLKAILEYEK